MNKITTGIKHIEYYFPEIEIPNEAFIDLEVQPEFLEKQIGIKKRFIAREDQGVTDLAFEACKKLNSNRNIDYSEIDCLIFCTETPDYKLPPCAPIMQEMLGIGKKAMCFDVNLGCSGFIFGIALAKSLIESLNFNNCILINAEAYSKIINRNDRTVATLFSDAATVTYIEKNCSTSNFIDFNFGTDGKGFDKLIVKGGGSKIPSTDKTREIKKITQGTYRSMDNLYMDGFEISKFVFKEVPNSINEILTCNNLKVSDINSFFFHQPNKYLLESLGKRMGLEEKKLYIDLSRGNTVSCSIPIALKDHYSSLNDPNDGNIILLSAFGVGYSWGNAIIRINKQFKLEL